MSNLLKSICFSVTLAVTMFALTASVNAQVRRGRARTGVRRNAKDLGMVNAARDAHTAHLSLKSTLPIYEGHRVLAMKFCALADKDIKEGLKGLASAPPVNFQDRKPLKLNKNEEKALAKYSSAQIQQSNQELQNAIPMIQSALQALGQASGDFGGYRTQAANSLNAALKEINISLEIGAHGVIHP